MPSIFELFKEHSKEPLKPIVRVRLTHWSPNYYVDIYHSNEQGAIGITQNGMPIAYDSIQSQDWEEFKPFDQIPDRNSIQELKNITFELGNEIEKIKMVLDKVKSHFE